MKEGQLFLKTGSKILAVHRRLFKDDQARYFVGTVASYEGGLVSVRGYSWVRDTLAGGFYRKEDLREKILSLVSGTLIVYKLPDDVEMNHLKFTAQGQKFFVSDGSEFHMDLTEDEFRQFHAES